jgi:predicted dinucleotide-utilizing enzyme
MISVSRRRPHPPIIVGLAVLLLVAVGCTGLLQNFGARWVTRQIAAEFNLDEAQTAATRASVDRLIAAAPGALGSKVDMLVATVDAAIAKGLTEKKLLGMERQVDALLDIVAGAIIDEAAPILATLRNDQVDFVEARIQTRLDEAREELAEPKEERLEKRQDQFVDAVEDWAGSLTDGQEDSLRKFVANLPDEAAARLAADERRVESVGAVFRRHPSAQAIRDTLWKEWQNREDWGPNARPPEARRAEGRRALLFVYGLLDSEQKNHASQHLHDLHAKAKTFLGATSS